MALGNYPRRETTSAAKAVPAARSAKYGGIEGGGSKPPFCSPGKGYRWLINKFEEGRLVKGNQSDKLTMTVVKAGPDCGDKVGDVVFATFRTAGGGCDSGRDRMKDFCAAAAGFETLGDYNEVDPEGYMLDAFHGLATTDEFAGMTLIGRYVDGDVQQGNPVTDDSGEPTGKYFNEFFWRAVPDEEQPS